MEIEHKIIIEEIEYHLSKVTFDIYALAMQEYLTGEGKVNFLGAGKVVFDACYVGNQQSLVDIQDDIKLYANICFRAAQIIQFMEGELKKN